MRHIQCFSHFIIVKIVLTALTFIEHISLVTSFHFWKRKSPLIIITRLGDLENSNSAYDVVDGNEQATTTTTTTLQADQIADYDDDDEDSDKKLAWARHTIMSIAATVMGVPTDVFTTPPMVDPRPPKTTIERAVRKKINNLLNKGYPDPLSGFEIPNVEIELMHRINHSDNSGHNPATYGEITFLGSRQLFHYMHIYDNVDDNEKPISFIDLGSGNGKLVVQAYLEIPNLASAMGVELSPSRHDFAISSWTNIKEEAKKIRSETLSCHTRSSSTSSRLNDEREDVHVGIQLLQGDLFLTEISEATHIYVASLCFTDAMMDSLGDKIKSEGRNLNYVATLKPFPITFEKDAGFRREARYVEMSWTKPRGIGGIVYFYSKK